jgi:hypothetical protein
MSKNTSIYLWGALALLLLAMIFLELQQDQETANDEQEDEVIYLSRQ